MNLIHYPKLFIALFGLSFIIIINSAFGQDTSYHAIPLENLDHSVKPNDNFYQFAVGNWIKKNPVPASKSSWVSFNEVFENNKKVLHQLLIEISGSHPAKGTNSQKIRDFYNTGMDSAKREIDGINPIKPYLNYIDKIQNTKDLALAFSFFSKSGISTAYRFGIVPDRKQSVVYLVNFSQGGIGLPDRDYYFNSSSKSQKIREAYQEHISRIFILAGFATEKAKEASHQAYELEQSLATASQDRVKLRDPYASYHKIPIQKLFAEGVNSYWKDQMKGLGLTVEKVDSVNIGQPLFFVHLDSIMTTVPLDHWKNYLRWKLLSSTAGILNSAFEKEAFSFNGTVLSGTKVMEKRWERMSALIDAYLGEALGQEYVKKAFPPEAKKRMITLVSNLRSAFAERISALDWMSDSTKKKALLKLNSITVKIGYPDKWKDYSRLDINGDNYFRNVMNAREFAFQYSLHQYGKPVDKTQWGMTPPTVNAYYNPSFNEIVFPAGILQPPFFDNKADDAVIYGGIGAVIGHEMTHGFDDQGRQYDAYGNLKNWWSQTDADQFKLRAQKVIDQFNQYVVLDTVHVNGRLTEGENLADLGGTMIAYQAFKKTDQGRTNSPKIDGFTPDQRFFLSFAQIWRGNTLPQASALRIVTDPHSPEKWRTIGPLSNNPNFYKAFDVKSGDGMYRNEDIRAKVW